MIKLPIRDYLGSIETTPYTIKTDVCQTQKDVLSSFIAKTGGHYDYTPYP